MTISGTGFTGATAVKFGSTDAVSFEADSEGTITAVAPPGSGTVDITVSSPQGTSSLSSADRYVYSQPPTVTKLKPTKGPVGGGTQVVISGTNLAGATAVKFGSASAASFTTSIIKGATAITAVSPASTPGTVDVTVTTPGGTSAVVPKDHFKFR